MTQVKAFNLFSVPLIMVNFGSDAKRLNIMLIEDILREQDQNPTESRSAIRGWQSEGGLENKYESFSQLATLIEKSIYSVLPSIGYMDIPEDRMSLYFSVGDMWANMLDKPGAFHIPHIHGTGETLFAGVYYPTSGLYADNYATINTNEDLDKDVEIRASSVPESGDLVLFDPASDIKRQVIPPFVKRYPYYGSEICIPPKQSSLIVFPNYLSHMVAPLQEPDFVRMSISFSLSKR